MEGFKKRFNPKEYKADIKILCKRNELVQKMDRHQAEENYDMN